MQAALSISIPFFALIFLGTWLRHRKFLDEAATRTLSRFAFYVVMPPFVFLNIANEPVIEILNPGFVLRFEAATIIMFLLAWPVARLLGLNLKETGILGLNAAYSNYGYIGVPLSILAFGNEAALPMALILFADTVVLLTLTVLYVTLGEGNGRGLKNLMMVPRALIGNPLLIAATLGMLVSAIDLSFPAPIHRLLEMVSGAAAPVALVALGASLSLGVLQKAKGEITIISYMKLIVHPLLVTSFFVFWPGQEEIWIKTAILCACLPIAANVFVLSDHYGAYQDKSATAIMASTVLATLTVPIILYWLFL